VQGDEAVEVILDGLVAAPELRSAALARQANDVAEEPIPNYLCLRMGDGLGLRSFWWTVSYSPGFRIRLYGEEEELT
jgi:hypothetical protein